MNTNGVQPPATTSKVRLWIAASLTFIPTAALIVAPLLWGDRLPTTVASHWSGSTPDGFAATTTFFSITLAVSLLAALVAAVTAIRASDSAPLILSVTGTAAATSATVWILSVALTLDAGTAENARIGWWIALPITAAMTGIAAWALTSRGRVDSGQPLPTPTLDTPLTASERAAWIGRAHSVWPWILSAGLTALTVGTAAYSDWWVAAILLSATVMTATFASVTVRVDNSGLSISSWGIRWKKIALSRVKSASVDTLRPMEWGGYGYRITPRGTAVTLRSGEAIVLTLETGRVFAVTVDHPEDGVRLLNSLVQQSNSREI